MSPEQMATMPYQQTPATAVDIAAEIGALSALIAGVMVGARDGRLGAELVNDGTKEPGRSVLVQQARLALALSSWQADGHEFIAKTTFEALHQGGAS